MAEDISLALITTAIGLAIAIPMSLAVASINIRIRKMEDTVNVGLSRILDSPDRPLGRFDAPLSDEDPSRDRCIDHLARSCQRRRPGVETHAVAERSNLDITPMIDVTFLLLIFFLVAAVPDVQAALDLPPASTASASVATRRSPFAWPKPPRAAQRSCISRRTKPVRRSKAPSMRKPPPFVPPSKRPALPAKRKCCIKAERRVRHREVVRVMQAADVEGMKINLAVMEPR